MKPYVFEYIAYAEGNKIGLGHLVARNEENALKVIKENLADQPDKVFAIALYKKSWLGELLILLLPKYHVVFKNEPKVIYL